MRVLSVCGLVPPGVGEQINRIPFGEGRYASAPLPTNATTAMRSQSRCLKRRTTADRTSAVVYRTSGKDCIEAFWAPPRRICKLYAISVAILTDSSSIDPTSQTRLRTDEFNSPPADLSDTTR